MASIEKRSDTTYRITVSCGYDSKGKKIRKYKTITLPENMTEKQIKKELEKQKVLFEQSVENGSCLDGEKITLEEFIKVWIKDYAEKELTPGTLNPYKTRLEKRIIPSLGHIKLSKLQPNHLLEFYNNLAEGGIRLDTYYQPTDVLIDKLCSCKWSCISGEIPVSFKTYNRLKEGNKTNITTVKKLCEYYNEPIEVLFSSYGSNEKLSTKTIYHHHTLISSVLSTAVEWNLITSNPAERVKPPKVIKKKSTYYDETELSMLFKALEEEPLLYKTIIYLAIDLGLRLSEVAGLEWKDLNIKESTIEIDKQRQYVSGYGIIEKEPKTNSGFRVVSISETVLNMLKKYKLVQNENRLKAGNMWVDTDKIFTHEDGTPIFPRLPSKWFSTFIERHNLPKITFHGLRHTNASLLISQGIDIVTLSGRLGHADKGVTLNTYSHIIKSKEKQVANNMDIFYSNISNSDSV